MTDQELVELARRYAKREALSSELKLLGFGDDGTVWQTDRYTVLKAFRRYSNYSHELECYRRLTDASVHKIREFNVPKLLNFDDELLLIEIGFVNPPYILDFGKAYLLDPQWGDEQIAEWNERMDFWWGDKVKQVRLALFALRRFGIWYYDAKPGNVMLELWDPPLDD